jgi:medium-chain acyl-[acyl-carrier-protein] hydrolase
MTKVTSSLIKLTKKHDDCSRGMFCIPSVGLGVAPFVTWAEALADVASVWAARLPGRENRILESPLHSIEEMAEELAKSAYTISFDELIIFGHCSGAWIAYELAYLLSNSLRHKNLILVVSAQVSPTSVSSRDTARVADMSLDELTVYLRSVGGTSEDILLNRELMELMEPALRADILAVRKYRCPSGRPKLSIPLVATAGNCDSMINESELCQWKELSTGPFTLKLVDGDHFYILQRTEEMIDFLKGLYTD